MTPTEMDFLHLRLQQIGEVLRDLAQWSVHPDPRTWDLIDKIARGMNDD